MEIEEKLNLIREELANNIQSSESLQLNIIADILLTFFEYLIEIEEKGREIEEEVNELNKKRGGLK